MAALLGSRIYLPQPRRWRDLTPSADAAVGAIEGARLAGRRVLRAEWSPERCHFSVSGEQLVVDVTITLDGEPTRKEVIGLYVLGRAVLHVYEVTPLAEPSDVTLERLDPESEAVVRARLGLDRPARHVVTIPHELKRSTIR
jgi:hypothetical protein